MTKYTKPKSKSSQPANPGAAPKPAPVSVQSAPRPDGKLGMILERLLGRTGATADELVKATGWQRHSVLGGLSKLKARGFAFRLDAQANRKAYRFETSKG